MNKLTKLFNNNRFIMVFSLVLSIIIWFVVSIVYSPQTGRTLSQIPIEISFSDESMGYKAYSKTELMANVDVSGKKYVVEQLSADSVVVSAVTDSVKGSGIYTLELKARKKTVGGDYTVVSVSPSTINVMIDVEKQLEYNVAIDCLGATVPETKNSKESLVLEPTFVDSANKVVTVTGPESEVRRISYVVAIAEVEKELTQSETYAAGLVAYDPTGLALYDANTGVSSLQYTTFSYDKTEVVAAVNLCKEVPLKMQYANAPARMPKVTLYAVTDGDAQNQKAVNTVTVKGAQSVIGSISEITLDGTVDFAKINAADPASMQVKLTLPAITGVTYEDYANLSGLYFLAVVDG